MHQHKLVLFFVVLGDDRAEALHWQTHDRTAGLQASHEQSATAAVHTIIAVAEHSPMPSGSRFHPFVRLPNRIVAGELLARALAGYEGRDDLLVLALPRGGVPIAAVVARALRAPLDLLLVRKLGVPGHEELAMGAIASGDKLLLNESLVRAMGIDNTTIERVRTREQRELERRHTAYRGTRPPPTIRDRCVIVIDDGIATGASMRVAVEALRQSSPSRVVVAVPILPPDTVETLRAEVDDLVYLATPEPFYGVGMWYEDFAQVDDDEVTALLQQAWES